MTGRNPKRRAEHQLYRLWVAMRQRCRDPHASNFAHYGGRGVSVCHRWEDFDSFCADIPPRPSMEHTLDRIDNDGNYEPGNVRWSTRTEQNRNRRTNRRLQLDGEVLTLAEWGERSGIDFRTIASRLSRGWSTPDAVSVRPNGRPALRPPPRTICRNGHALDEGNAYVHPDGSRRCRACLRGDSPIHQGVS